MVNDILVFIPQNVVEYSMLIFKENGVEKITSDDTRIKSQKENCQKTLFFLLFTFFLHIVLFGLKFFIENFLRDHIFQISFYIIYLKLLEYIFLYKIFKNNNPNGLIFDCMTKEEVAKNIMEVKGVECSEYRKIIKRRRMQVSIIAKQLI